MKAKVKKVVRKALSILSLFEGAIHLIVSLVSLWGIFTLGTYDWRIMTAPIADLVFAFVAIGSGIFLGEWRHTHNHSHKKKGEA